MTTDIITEHFRDSLPVGLQSDTWELISSANRDVYESKENPILLKVSNDPSWEFEKENFLFSQFSGESTIIKPQDKGSAYRGLLLEKIGCPSAPGDSLENLEDLLKQIWSIHQSELVCSAIPVLSAFKTLTDRFRNRMPQDSYESELLHSYTREHRDILEHVEGDSLTHSDLQFKNIVASPERLHIIDWESACIAAPEVDVAVIYMNFIYNGWNPDKVLSTYPGEIDMKNLAAGIVFKGLSGASYVYWKYGEQDFYQYINDKLKVSLAESERLSS